MSAFLKLLASKIMRVVAAKLLPWLVSQAAAFAAEYLNQAVVIVQDAQRLVRMDDNGQMVPETGRNKFESARCHLMAQLNRQGVAYKEHWIDTAVQTAVGVMKAQAEALEAKKG